MGKHSVGCKYPQRESYGGHSLYNYQHPHRAKKGFDNTLCLSLGRQGFAHFPMNLRVWSSRCQQHAFTQDFTPSGLPTVTGMTHASVTARTCTNFYGALSFTSVHFSLAQQVDKIITQRASQRSFSLVLPAGLEKAFQTEEQRYSHRKPGLGLLIQVSPGHGTPRIVSLVTRVKS